MQTIRIRTSQNIDIDYEVASVGDRILAWVVDYGIFMGVFYALYMIVILFFLTVFQGLATGSGIPVGLIVVIVIYTLVYSFYDLVAEIFFNGQSIGKYAIKIRVVSLNGARPTIGQFFLRWMFRLLDIALTGGIAAIISIAVSEKKQRIGDMIAGTTVIKTKPRTELNELFFLSPDEEYEPLFPSVNNLSDADITLVHEIISNFKTTRNSQLVYDMAMRIKDHLGIEIPKDMNEFDFLRAIAKDYNYVTSRMAV